MDDLAGRVIAVLSETKFDLRVTRQRRDNLDRYAEIERVIVMERIGKTDAAGRKSQPAGEWLVGLEVRVTVATRDDFGCLLGRYRVIS